MNKACACDWVETKPKNAYDISAVAAVGFPPLLRSRRRTAAGRRAQRKRAEGRVVMRLMACFQEVLRRCLKPWESLNRQHTRRGVTRPSAHLRRVRTRRSA